MSSLFSLIFLLPFLFLFPFIHASEYWDASDYDPIMTLSFTTPLQVTTDISTKTGLHDVPNIVQYKHGWFGGNIISPFNRSSETVPVVVAFPLEACTELQHPDIGNATKVQIEDYYKGKIVLTMSGDCSTSIKAGHCERVGALLHLMTMSDSSPFRLTLNGAKANPNDTLIIPNGAINYEVGYTLIEAMLANRNVTVMGTVATTGPALPSDRAAITSIIRNLISLPIFPVPGTQYQGMSSFSMYLDDATAPDPCLHRLAWTRCVGGRIVAIEWDSLGDEFVGIFDPLWGQLTALSLLNIGFNPGLSGPIPCEWGQLSNLKVLFMSETDVTEISSCIGEMSSLELVTADFLFSLNSLPTEMSKLINMQIISFNTCNISTPLFSFTNWTKLKIADFNNNHIPSPIPSLQSARHTLINFYVTDNELTYIDPHHFDDFTTLQKVDIARNHITGTLPTFNNTNTIIDLGFDHNHYTGILPQTWYMPNLIMLRGSNNKLYGGMEILHEFTSLKSVDLSANQFYLPPRPDPAHPNIERDIVAYLSHVLPSGIQIIILSQNQFNGTFDSYFAQTTIKQLYLDHNNLTYMTEYLFHLHQSPELPSSVQVIDLSFNPMMEGHLGVSPPTSDLQVLKLHGCPLLHDTTYVPAALPPYIMTSTDQITKNSDSERYICPSLKGSYYPLQFSIDPSYYDYKGCVCDQGTYGTPPACLLIPISTNTSADPITITGTITDAIYGSARMSIGIDTAWSIGMIGTINITNTSVTTNVNVTTSNTTSPINTTTVFIGSSQHTRIIYITITFASSFSNFSDIIDIYAGEHVIDIPVISIRGSEKKPFHTNEMDIIQNIGYPYDQYHNYTHTYVTTYVVFASYATLNFRSRKTMGQHFIANYTLSSTCPSRYKIWESTCQRSLPIYEISSSIQNLVYVISAFVLLIIIIAMIGLLMYRETVVFRAASVLFCFTILLFAAILSIGSIMYVLSPHEPNVCEARIWLSTLSLVGLLGSLLTKANRIRNLFTNLNLTAMKHAVKTRVAMRTLMAMMMIQFILLIALSAADLTHTQLIIGEKTTAGYQVYTCTSVETRSYQAWLIIQLTYIGVFLFTGLYIAFSIRNVPSAFNESSHIVNSLYLLSLLTIILLPLNFIVDDNPSALAVIRGLGQNLVALSMTAAIFGSKFYYLLDGKANDKSMIETHHTHMGAILPMSSSMITNPKLDYMHQPSTNTVGRTPNEPISKIDPHPSASVPTLTADEPKHIHDEGHPTIDVIPQGIRSSSVSSHMSDGPAAPTSLHRWTPKLVPISPRDTLNPNELSDLLTTLERHIRTSSLNETQQEMLNTIIASTRVPVTTTAITRMDSETSTSAHELP